MYGRRRQMSRLTKIKLITLISVIATALVAGQAAGVFFETLVTVIGLIGGIPLIIGLYLDSGRFKR